MAREYYEIRALNGIFRSIHAIPVERTGRDFASTRSALRALKQGNIVGVFPEGKINETGEPLPYHTGVAMMAIKAGVPVYPAFLDGTQRGKEMPEAFRWPNRCRVAFGPKIDFERDASSHEALEAATQKIRAAVEKLAMTIRGAV